MKIATVLGTRPEIIRLSRVIDKLDQSVEHLLVDTGQNYDPKLSDIFYSQLGVRKPDHVLGVREESFGAQIGQILARTEKVFTEERPDRLLLLGDTNSALSSIVAKRIGIPVFHMEAGNRCYDDRVPEEVNRRIIDHSSDILMPYTERSRANLLREGIAGERIFVTGNPIKEVIDHFAAQIADASSMADLSVEPGQFFLVTLHRAENVDVRGRLGPLLEALARIAAEYALPIVVSTHPRTADRIRRFNLVPEGDVRLLDPMGFFDFVNLETNALCVLSDSGTVQEECAILNKPNVTLRDVTERPETIECGSNILSGADPDNILRCVAIALSRPPSWSAPPEYLVEDVSSIAARIVTGFYPTLAGS